MSKKTEFHPQWFEGDIPQKSFRSIFKWGDPKEYKHPNKRLYRLMKETFHLCDEDFQQPVDYGLDAVDTEFPCKLDARHLEALQAIVGEKETATDTYTRLSVSYGKTMLDSMRLREKCIENIPDLVLYPANSDQIEMIIQYCHKHAIPVYVFGGGSSVTKGCEAVKGGVTMDMRKNFNKVLHFNETNQTITVQAGMSGPDLEKTLNNAKTIFNAARNYTCGHLPQSFEYSVVGGWVVTRGAGQNSTYYGKIEDLVIAQEYITPQGRFHTHAYPAEATGPSIDQMMIGSEGCFGILGAVTLKIHRYMPENTRRFSYFFPDWDSAKAAMREIMQSESGMPSVCRLSDPEETSVGLKLYGVEGTVLDTLMSFFGIKRGKRCLFLATADGSKAYTKMVHRNISKICRKYKAMPGGSYATKKWEHGRFRDPYMREDLQDYGILIDTLECSVNWNNLEDVYQHVRTYCKSRKDTIHMTHMSHCYPQGCNLYFIFISRFTDREDFKNYHQGILDAIQESGAAMSHHHGIGKLFAPWLEGYLGSTVYDALRVLKQHFDPKNILNPGGTLGFDLEKNDKRFKSKEGF